jgi:hypothetical protein
MNRHVIGTLDFRLALALSLVVASTGCGGSASTSTPAAPSAPATASSIAITGTALLTAVGQTSQLAATATLSDGTTQTVTSSAAWQSSDENVVTVSRTGLATAVGAGQTTIMATAQSKSATFAMNVSIAEATTTFHGTVAGGSGQSGTFMVRIQTGISSSGGGGIVRTLASVGASGTLMLTGSGASALAGTFDTLTKVMNLSGGGFALTGTTGQGAASGTYTGPASTSGGFAGLDATRNTVTVMCGTYSGSNTGTGIWNLQFSASGAASGVTRPDLSARDPQPRTTLLTGRLEGAVLTLRSVEDGATATGVVQGDRVTGTHDDGRGTFSGSTTGCR